jgi:hypothetical protein
MFDRLRNGWLLDRESFSVLKADKKLLIFPLLSFLSCLLVLASFVLPLINTPWARESSRVPAQAALASGFST